MGSFTLANIEKMIIAHPDDESIFGGSLLIEEQNWKVICVTNKGYEREEEFEQAMKFLKIKDYAIWDFRDDFYEPWSVEETKEISNRLEAEIRSDKYGKVVTHGEEGEYGHIQHKALHQIVKNLVTDNLFVFGKGEKQLEEETLRHKIKLLQIYKTQLPFLDNLLWYIKGDRELEFDSPWGLHYWITNEETIKFYRT